MAPRRTPAQRTPWTKQSVVAVVVLGMMGFTVGTLLTGFLPEGGVFADGRARVRLHKDTAKDLLAAIDITDGVPELAGTGALARLLLWHEHGAADDVKATAERLLQKAPASVRTSPEGLYARALTAAMGGADVRLVEELAAAGDDAWTLLARATLTDVAGDVDGTALVLFERAALLKDPLPHATHRLARAAAHRGDLPFARAALERLFHLAPDHAAGAVTAAVVAVAEAHHAAHATDEEVAGVVVVAGADEARVVRLLDDSTVDGLDHVQLALVAAVLAQARGAVPDGSWSAPLQGAGPNVTERALELALLVGDVDTAELFVKQQPTMTSLSLLADVARTRYLRAVPDDERRAASKSARHATRTSIVLPLGQLVFDFTRPGLPMSALPSPSFFPERRLQRLLLELEADGSRERLEPRLVAVEKLGLVDRAVARGDLVAADALLKQARELAGADADLALTEAAVRARQNDPVGVKNAIAAAMAAAPLEPAVLLTAARLSLDVDDLGGARRALSAFNRLGMKSASASAITALLEAKSGDTAAARTALADTKRLGGEADIAALRAVLLANRLVDVVEARAAADALLERADHGEAGGGDVVATWIAEAAWRKGDQPRAQAALKAIVDTRPQIAEAHLFFASTIAFVPQRKAEAIVEVTKAIKALGKSDLGTEAKQLLIRLKSPKK